jgi:acetyl esterase/lipase
MQRSKELTEKENKSLLGTDRFWYEPIKTFAYKETPQGALEMHVHLPHDLYPGEQRPAILFFFGGGWKGGTTRQFARQATYLASKGMVAARADYRVQSRHGVTPDACVEDAKSAVRWLRGHAAELCIDPARIVGSGGSAGAHIAACAALVEGFEAAGEDRSISCRPDVLLLYNPVLEVLPRHIPGMVPTVELGEQLSPVRYVDERTPPTLLLYGTDDHLGEPAPPYVEKAKAAGCRAELYLADGQKHGFFNDAPWMERTLERAEAFLISLGYISS